MVDKGPMQTFGGFLSGGYCLFECGEVTKPEPSAAYSDVCGVAPGVTSLPEVYALDAGCGVFASTAMSGALVWCRGSQVSDAVVERIHVDMVDGVGNRLAINQQPRNAVGFECRATEAELPVIGSVSCMAASHLARELCVPPVVLVQGGEVTHRSSAPSEHPCIVVIVHTLANKTDIRQSLGSHCVDVLQEANHAH